MRLKPQKPRRPRRLNVIWCEYWDDTCDMPGGHCRDLGRYPLEEVAAAARRGWYHASREGWGPGEVVVTDRLGRRVELSRIFGRKSR